MATMQDIVDAALKEGGIDATQTQALAWGNDRYRRLVAGAKWRKLFRELGPTVANQARYSLADDAVDVLSVRVDGSAPYKLISVEELWELQSSESIRLTKRGLFAPAYDDDSEAESIELYPTPTTAGKAITAQVAVLPPALALGDVPKIPEHFHQVLTAGVIADGLMRIDEAHADAAQWETRFQDGIERLRRLRNSKVGRGPTAIRLVR